MFYSKRIYQKLDNLNRVVDFIAKLEFYLPVIKTSDADEWTSYLGQKFEAYSILLVFSQYLDL